jgi:high-affinity iron transporter
MFALSSALQAGVILLREGLEALLVIAALAGFLRRAGADGAIRTLYAGAGAALVASVGAAIAFSLFLNGAHDDRIEAGVMILAAALMLYMSGWLFLRQDGRTWTQEMRDQASRALSSGTLWSLGLISFLAVFREGAETVLFLHALAASEGGWNLAHLAGLSGAALCLAGLFLVIENFAVRLPLRPVFLATSALLFVMSLRFIGGAIQELQEQQILDVHPFNTLSEWIIALGFNATWEALGTQLVIGLVAAVGFVVVRRSQAAATTA